MNELEQSSSKVSKTSDKKGIIINNTNYSYSLNKSENKEESLIIKLFDQTEKSNIYFTYEASMEKLAKDIKFLALCENLDEMIESLEEVFSQGNAHVEEKDGEFSMEFKVSGIKKKCIIQLTKNEIKQANEGKDDKYDKLEKKFKDLFNKYEELKLIKKNEIKDIVKEVYEKDMKKKILEDMEQILLSKYNLSNIAKNKSQSESQNQSIENKIVNKVQEVSDSKNEKINNQISNLQEQINKNIKDINKIKSAMNDNNYISFQVKIEEKNLNSDVLLFNQVDTYKYFCNFERDDIETYINDQIVDIKCKIIKENIDSKTQNEKNAYPKYPKYEYYWNFTTEGIHNIKVIFKKKLLKSNKLFFDCKYIYKIDCSNFDCSQIIDCSDMFHNCYSLTEINLGKLDFALSTDFSGMFRMCKILEKLDVSYFNTKNSKSFRSMFNGCSKLKEINVTKFTTSNCEDISYMFYYCKSLESIDMLNWDMKNINDIDYLFNGCCLLKNIKMNFNNNNPNCYEGKTNNYQQGIIYPMELAFEGLPKSGCFVWKKGLNCDKLLNYIPVSWNRNEE